MATLLYNKLIPTAFSGATAQAGYPISNLALECLGMPWKATTAGGGETPTLSLAALTFVQAFCLQDCNFSSATIRRAPDGVNFVDVGVMNLYSDEHGRYRGMITVAQNAKDIRIVPIGAPNDGLGYWRGGAAYFFGASLQVKNPVYGYGPNTKRPRISTDLANGRTAQCRTGLNIDQVEYPYYRRSDESLRDIRMKAEAGSIWLSLDIPDWPWQMWPLRYLDSEARESYPKVHRASGSLTLTEIT